MFAWRQLSLLERIRRLRYILPPLLALVVVWYQLGLARFLEEAYGHVVHYGVEIAFYSLAGPVVTWLTLAWVEQSLTEKERLEQQVRAREQHLASLTAASADAILSLDGSGHITSWNRGAERIFGYKAEMMIGQSITDLLPEANLLFERLKQEGVVQNFETTAHAQDGRRITVDLTQTLLMNDQSEPSSSSLIMRDVTARHERAAVLEEERERIARDLHDGVAQVLYLMALKADMAAAQVIDQPDQVTTALTEIGQRSREVIREIRRTIFALRPLDWSKGEFLPALRRFVHNFAEQVNWQVSIQEKGENLTVPTRLEATIFRLVQESLNNVAKHAQAKQVWVEISQIEPGSLLKLKIRDDGLGFDAATASRAGLGLQQMQRRVEQAGGVFTLNSQVDDGTTIAASFPIAGEIDGNYTHSVG